MWLISLRTASFTGEITDAEAGAEALMGVGWAATVGAESASALFTFLGCLICLGAGTVTAFSLNLGSIEEAAVAEGLRPRLPRGLSSAAGVAMAFTTLSVAEAGADSSLSGAGEARSPWAT